MRQQDKPGSQCLHQHHWIERVVVRKLFVVAVEVGTQVHRKVDRKAGLRTIVGVVEDSNPPVLAVDLGVGSTVAAARRSNPCWPYFNIEETVN